eukprot:g37500.t1
MAAKLRAPHFWLLLLGLSGLGLASARLATFVRVVDNVFVLNFFFAFYFFCFWSAIVLFVFQFVEVVCRVRNQGPYNSIRSKLYAATTKQV